MDTPTITELEERYAQMTADEFDALIRANLTEEAQAVYDKEAARRNSPEELAKLAQHEQELAAAETVRYVGVRGWLLFFCLSLTVFSPVASSVSLWFGYQSVSQYADLYPGIKRVAMIDFPISIAIIYFSIYAGVALWRRKQNAVRIAKAYLLTFFGYTVVAVFLPFMAGLPSAGNETMIFEVIKGLVRSALYVSIWYMYLTQSKRVRATYP
jgi:hypothetical protein